MSGPVRKYDRQEVADIYLRAAEAGEYPSQAIERRYGVSRNAAAQIVKRARADGLLPPTKERAGLHLYAMRQGIGPHRNPKVAALAVALGLPYTIVRQAVLDSCDGDIRVGTSSS